MLISEVTYVVRASPLVNDRPSNQRMGFGFEQARAAGGALVAPRPVGVVNFLLQQRTATRELRKLVQHAPFVEQKLREFIALNGATHSPDYILFYAICFAAEQSSAGFTITGHDGKDITLTKS